MKGVYNGIRIVDGESTENRIMATSKSQHDQTSADLARVGQTVARKYRVLDVLRSSSVGTTFLAEPNEGTRAKRVALKVISADLSGDSRYRERFIQEARAASLVVNRYVVVPKDVGSTEDDRLYCAMDYWKGQTLAGVLDEEGWLPIRSALRVVRKVLRGVEAAHAAGMTHRDVNPSRIMIVNTTNRSRSVRVLGFGIARRPGAAAAEYAAPELLSGSEASAATDLYSIGAVMYESLTGVTPQRGSGSPPSPEEFRPEVQEHEGLTAVVMKAIEPDPEKRVESASRFAYEIQRVLNRHRLEGEGRSEP